MAFDLENYEPVAVRLARWLDDCKQRNVTPKVVTYLVHYLADTAVFRAEIYEDDRLIATGWEEEIRGSSPVNRTSHLANAETGAVGRALANAGYAGSDPSKRPSREEMSKVSRYEGSTSTENGPRLASDKQRNMIRAVCKAIGRTVPDGLDQMTSVQASRLIDELKKQEGARADAPEDPF